MNSISKIDFLKIDIEGGEFAILDQLVELKRKETYRTLFLSIHYDHLNEAVYQKKIRYRLLSLFLMKLERIANIHFFKKELQFYLNELCKLTDEFDYIYSQNGKRLLPAKVTASYLLNRKVDLLLSDTEWNKNKITKT